MNLIKGTVIASSVAALLAAIGCSSDDAKPAPTGSTTQGQSVKCRCVNTCKGTSECAASGHDCTGKNSCAGEGWVTVKEADCVPKGGVLLTAQNEQEDPAKVCPNLNKGGAGAAGASGAAGAAGGSTAKSFKCEGANSCMGNGSCAGMGHDCAGKNSCKGQSYIYTTDQAECDSLKAAQG
jgi:hypothetical protein